MKCPNGHEVNGHVKFCPTCGADLRGPNFCTNCGCERNENKEICPHCGKPYKIQSQKVIDSEEKSNKKLFILLIIVCVTLMVLGSWLYINKEHNVNVKQAEQVDEPFEEIIEAADSVSPDGNVSHESIGSYRSSNDNSSSSSSYNTTSDNNSDYYSEATSKTFANEQYVTMYLANQTFINYNGVDIRIDGSLRIYIGGDYAGVVSVLRYNSKSALIRYGGGAYGEGKIGVSIENDKVKLNDPVDGSTWYQK